MAAASQESDSGRKGFSLMYTVDPMLVQEADIESDTTNSCVSRQGRKRMRNPDNWKPAEVQREEDWPEAECSCYQYY